MGWECQPAFGDCSEGLHRPPGDPAGGFELEDSVLELELQGRAMVGSPALEPDDPGLFPPHTSLAV